MADGGLPAWEREPERELEDGEARARILRELDRNLVVEAAAGAGKTHALVGRIVALLATGRCAIDEIAAVTFTRKAAGELRGRLLTHIESAIAVLEEAGDPEPETRRRLGSALDEFEQSFTGTIHSFCARLLRERPVEAGVDPGFDEVDPREESSLRREAWDRHLDRQSEEPSERLGHLEELGIDPEDLYPTFETLCDYPEVEVPREEVPAPDLGRAVGRLEGFVDWALPQIPDDPVEGRYDGMQTTLFTARSFLQNRRLEDAAARAEFLKLFDGGTGFTLKLWGDNDIGHEVRHRFEELQEEAIVPALRAWREHCYPAVVDFLDPAVRRYARVRDDRGMLNFQDLLLRTARMLREHPEVREHFAARFPRILVDEFQDTDPVQAETLLLLTGEEREETNWRRMTPRPGSLFLVGDPKQSIYRFRRADVDVYRFVRDRIEDADGEVVPLRTSFRSLGPLVAWLNESLEPVVEAHDREVQPPFVRLAPYRRDDGAHPCVRRVLHEKVRRNPATDVAEEDADRVARWIRRAVDAEPGELLPGEVLDPGEVLILLRQKKHLSVYARALEEQGLPYEVTGGGAVSESEELDSLLKMAEAALHPDDPLALVAYLRGSLVGLSDDALYRFRQAGGVWDYGAYTRRGRQLPEVEEAETFEGAFRDLDRAYTWLQSLPPATALERLMSHTGILAHAAGLAAGSSRAGSLYRVLSLVRDWQAGGRDVAGILEKLRMLSEGEGPDVDEMVLEVGRSDVVRVMNVHKAKGLQARVVFLADPLKKSSGWVDRHIERVEEDEARGHFRACRTNRYGRPVDDLAHPPEWEDLEAIEQRYRDAEETRLLYVAATRARDLLVVSHYPYSDKGPWTPLFDALEEVPELEVPAPEAIPAGAHVGGDQQDDEHEPVEPPDVTRLEARRRALAEPSYTVVQPSDLVHDRIDVRTLQTPGEDRETALAFGRVVHQLLREIVEGENVPNEALVRRRLEAEGGDPATIPAAMAAVRRIGEAWFWPELERADRVLCEVPFGRWMSDGEMPALERGIVDLAFRGADGWRIVDYKTHRTEEEAVLDSLTELLGRQVAAYRSAWEDVSGEPVSRAGLYFTQAATWREVGR